MVKKAPAFQFYPGDWLRDPGIRACPLTSRGLWIEMICLMSDSQPNEAAAGDATMTFWFHVVAHSRFAREFESVGLYA